MCDNDFCFNLYDFRELFCIIVYYFGYLLVFLWGIYLYEYERIN